MKKITLLAALMIAAPVLAQQPAKDAAKPAAPAQQAPKAEAAKPAEKPAEMAKAAPKKNTPTRRTEDARQCLEKGTNTEIIKCAEEYL